MFFGGGIGRAPSEWQCLAPLDASFLVKGCLEAPCLYSAILALQYEILAGTRSSIDLAHAH